MKGILFIMNLFFIMLFIIMVLNVWTGLILKLWELIKSRRFNRLIRITVTSICLMFLIVFHIYVVPIILSFNISIESFDTFKGLMVSVINQVAIIILITAPLLTFSILDCLFTIQEKFYKKK